VLAGPVPVAFPPHAPIAASADATDRRQGTVRTAPPLAAAFPPPPAAGGCWVSPTASPLCAAFLDAANPRVVVRACAAGYKATGLKEGHTPKRGGKARFLGKAQEEGLARKLEGGFPHERCTQIADS
jgi:hypothetical protein